MALITLVDEDNNEIGVRERSELQPGDVFRAVVLNVTDPAGRILLAQRSHTKSYNPSLWGTAAAGVVDAGESYEEAVLREAAEEIGLVISPADLQTAELRRIPGTDNSYFAQHYTHVTTQTEFILQEEEVAAIRWYTLDELIQAHQKNPEQFLNGIADLIAKQKIKNPPDQSIYVSK